MKRRYRVLLLPDEDGWITAEVPALPDCVTQGPTREEALANAREAIELTLEGLVEQGEPIPPDDFEIVEVEVAPGP